MSIPNPTPNPTPNPIQIRLSPEAINISFQSGDSIIHVALSPEATRLFGQSLIGAAAELDARLSVGSMLSELAIERAATLLALQEAVDPETAQASVQDKVEFVESLEGKDFQEMDAGVQAFYAEIQPSEDEGVEAVLRRSGITVKFGE